MSAFLAFSQTENSPLDVCKIVSAAPLEAGVFWHKGGSLSGARGPEASTHTARATTKEGHKSSKRCAPIQTFKKAFSKA